MHHAPDPNNESHKIIPSVVFLGGIFTPKQTDMIISDSRGGIQNAADALQKNLVKGLVANGVDVAVVNLPFIASYPKGYKQKRFPPTRETIFESVPVGGQGFWLIPIVRPFSRFWGALRGLSQADMSRRSVIIVYAAHLPFIVAALFHRLVFRKTRICLVLPDFPEFMAEGGRLYTIAKTVESRIFYAIARQIDCFVLLTRFMAVRLGLTAGRYTVVEGIADDPPAAAALIAEEIDKQRRVFLYTGTLAARYGIMDLVKAFTEVKNPAAELWICGDGDSRDRILEHAARNTRIKFLGQVSRAESRRLQSEATVLVNPRPPLGTFTRYSFPSKTLEYMASGRPVLMHPLPGMPDEYLPHFVSPKSIDLSAMSEAMEAMADWDRQKLVELGARARAFVLEEKNAEAQCRKIVDLISSIASVR